MASEESSCRIMEDSPGRAAGASDGSAFVSSSVDLSALFELADLRKIVDPWTGLALITGTSLAAP